jgi:hypothetical protein
MVLILKSALAATPDDSVKDPLPGKLRLILQSRVKEAKTKEDRERAEEELRKFEAGASS